VEVTDAATDATEDALEVSERASSPSNGEREDDGVGNDGSSLHSCPRPRPRDFLPMFFDVFFGMTVMLILPYLVRLSPHSTMPTPTPTPTRPTRLHPYV